MKSFLVRNWNEILCIHSFHLEGESNFFLESCKYKAVLFLIERYLQMHGV